jgi:hypothetical protein
MKTLNSKLHTRKTGFTIIELMAAVSTATVVMLSAAMLVSSGWKGWNQSYNNANRESRLGAMDSMIALGAIGRKSNKLDYRLYEVTGSTFERVVPSADPEEILTGQAVEFRYWDTELSPDLMNPDVNATAYALFYIDNGQFKVDYGPYPPGAVNSSGHRITGGGIRTVSLTTDVTSVEFSHTSKNMTGDGVGCVRMRLVITDPTDGQTKTTLAATLMRNTWPQ